MLSRMLCSGCARHILHLIRPSLKAPMLKCAQMHWRALRQAFKSSCYHLDPKAEKRELLRHYCLLLTVLNVHLNKH